MSAGDRKHPARLAPARNATHTARIVCDTLILIWLVVTVALIAGAYVGVIG